MMLRVASVSYSCEKKSFGEFEKSIESILSYAFECKVEIIVFPEYLTAALVDKLHSHEIFTDKYINLFSNLAKKYQIYIAAGTHPTKLNSAMENCAYFFLPTGEYEIQAKIHLVPNENYAGKQNIVTIFNHPKAKIAILVCYDIEFPEIVRAVVKKGAEVILVPTYTTDFQGDCRVAFCSQARCIENHIYVVKAPLIGRNIEHDDYPQGFGRAQIFSPCDISFPPGGLVAQGPENQTFMVMSDLIIEHLHMVRSNGSTTPLKHIKPHYVIGNKDI